DKQKITAQWIDRVSNENHKVDKILVEKAIRAFLLLEGLVNQKLPFVFKGGTALMLLMDSTKRLSIDIDIVLRQAPENLEETLYSVAKEQGFVRVENQHRATQSL